MELIRNWKPIINKFDAKLSKQKSKVLSFGGCLTLIKSILSNLGVYYFLNLDKNVKTVGRKNITKDR